MTAPERPTGIAPNAPDSAGKEQGAGPVTPDGPGTTAPSAPDVGGGSARDPARQIVHSLWPLLECPWNGRMHLSHTPGCDRITAAIERERAEADKLRADLAASERERERLRAALAEMRQLSSSRNTATWWRIKSRINEIANDVLSTPPSAPPRDGAGDAGGTQGETCRTCGGAGVVWVPGRAIGKCRDCEGTGKRQAEPQLPDAVVCRDCNAEYRPAGKPCPACGSRSWRERQAAKETP